MHETQSCKLAEAARKSNPVTEDILMAVTKKSLTDNNTSAKTAKTQARSGAPVAANMKPTSVHVRPTRSGTGSGTGKGA
jgi:hypothetical protein